MQTDTANSCVHLLHSFFLCTHYNRLLAILDHPVELTYFTMSLNPSSASTPTPSPAAEETAPPAPTDDAAKVKQDDMKFRTVMHETSAHFTKTADATAPMHVDDETAARYNTEDMKIMMSLDVSGLDQLEKTVMRMRAQRKADPKKAEEWAALTAMLALGEEESKELWKTINCEDKGTDGEEKDQHRVRGEL